MKIFFWLLVILVVVQAFISLVSAGEGGKSKENPSLTKRCKETITRSSSSSSSHGACPCPCEGCELKRKKRPKELTPQQKSCDCEGCDKIRKILGVVQVPFGGLAITAGKEKPETSEESESPETAEKPDTPEKFEKPETSKKPDKGKAVDEDIDTFSSDTSSSDASSSDSDDDHEIYKKTEKSEKPETSKKNEKTEKSKKNELKSKIDSVVEPLTDWELCCECKICKDKRKKLGVKQEKYELLPVDEAEEDETTEKTETTEQAKLAKPEKSTILGICKHCKTWRRANKAYQFTRLELSCPCEGCTKKREKQFCDQVPRKIKILLKEKIN